MRFDLGFEHSLPPPTESVGGSGLGARALAVRDEARATREKIRSIGWALPRTRPRRLYFRVGLSNPTSATKNPRTASPLVPFGDFSILSQSLTVISLPSFREYTKRSSLYTVTRSKDSFCKLPLLFLVLGRGVTVQFLKKLDEA